MRIFRLILLPLLLAAATSSYAQAPYIDPSLRNLAQPNVQAALRAGAPTADSLLPGVALRRTHALETPRVALFAKIRGAAAIAELVGLGGHIGSRVGDIVTAEVPIDQLQQLFLSPYFEVLEASHTVTVQNDSGMHAIGADLVRRVEGGVWTGSAGRGVLVGVYDTGLDFTHDDFIDAAGSTRVLALWDQTDPNGPPPSGFNYGRLCTRAEIQQTIANPNSTVCPQRDTNGHGTHVAGTAAGDGSAIGTGGIPFTYAGVAPLADLLVVKGGDGRFSESSIIDGLVFLEQQARALNRPIAVNLSIGGQAGPHDGTRLYETAIDQLSRAGFVVVISAGNDGINNNDRNRDGSEPFRLSPYFHASALPGTTRDFVVEIGNYTPLEGVCNDFVTTALWYEGSDRLGISVIRPDGVAVTADFSRLVQQNSAFGNIRIDNASGGPNVLNNDYEADIRINDCGTTGTPPTPGKWTIRVTTITGVSNKPYHLWMYSQSLGAATAIARGRDGFDNHFVVSSPGASRSALTVGAFASKMCWSSPAKPQGPVCFTTFEALGDLARFSSGGPTRDGRLKPEITAPGLGVASARSSFSFPAANRILADGVHWVNQGTSMAAPHVTGAVALMLEKQPSLDVNGVRDILSRTSNKDPFTARVYDTSADASPAYWWGYGKLNVCASLGAIGSGSGTGPVVITPAADTLPVNATTRFFSCSPTGASIAFRSLDPAIANIDDAGVVRALTKGIARLVASSGSFEDTALVVVTDPANLHVALRNVAPAEAARSARDTKLPLLATVLRVNGYEAMRVTQLSYRVTSSDPSARLILVADANRNGSIDSAERIIAMKQIATAGSSQVDLQTDSLFVQQRDSVSLIAGVELTGASPNGSTFAAEFIPAATKTIGVRSSAANRIEPVTTPLASSIATTTVLGAGEVFSISENPVRSGRIVFNFASAPRVARLYTLTGRMVADLKERMSTSGSIVWNLTNDQGTRVATGVYLAVFDFGTSRVRQKIFILPTTQAQ